MDRLPDGQVTRWTGYQMDRLPDRQVTRWTGYHGTIYRWTGYHIDRLPDGRVTRWTFDTSSRHNGILSTQYTRHTTVMNPDPVTLLRHTGTTVHL